MSVLWLMGIVLVLLILAYFTYGKFIAKKFGIDKSAKTPAHTHKDGVDYVPAKAPVLLGHHFASIAGAAPIVGPIIAATFGWVPAIIWILVGGIFFGAVHDFTSLIASVRHEGRSIGEVIEKYIGLSGINNKLNWGYDIVTTNITNSINQCSIKTIPPNTF